MTNPFIFVIKNTEALLGGDFVREKKLNVRGLALILAFVMVISSFFATLVKVQIIDGKIYAAAGSSISSKSVAIKAARGEILDRNGSPLVTNRPGNSIIFESAYFPSSKEQEKRNEIILSLIKLFEQADVEWIDNLPIFLDANGVPFFSDDRDTDIAAMKSKDMLNLNDYATAENCLDALIEKYFSRNIHLSMPEK